MKEEIIISRRGN
jgi:hypothetical protein